MKRTIVSGLGICLVLPVFAGARLPVVNVAAGAVSARAQYGLSGAENVNSIRPDVSEPTLNKAQTTNRRKVVARNSHRATTSMKDGGEKIAMDSDVLNPNRPVSNLWAQNDVPLRMPRANEFSVITSDALLPEESIEKIADATVVSQTSAQVSSLDAQIERMIAAQRHADATRAKRVEPMENGAPITQNVIETPRVADLEIKNTKNDLIARADTANVTDGVRISRVVVSRDEPVADVRPAVPVRAAKTDGAVKIKETRQDMTKMSPAELRRAFRKTFLSENKHLSTYSIDDRFDMASDIGTSIEGFTSARDLSEDADKIRNLEIKIKFRNEDSSLSRENYNLLSEYAGTVVANPKRAIQIAIPVAATETSSARKLAARRLAIVEQVLRDTGVSEQRIVPVLAQRDDEGFVLRIISNEQYETLTKQKRNMFGDTVGSKTYKSMSW